MSSLGEEYPKAQVRLRAIIQIARETGPAGLFMCVMAEDCLRRADRAIAEQDLPAMIAAYQEMMEFKE